MSGSSEASVRGRTVDENLWRGSISCIAATEAGETYSLVVDDLDDRGQVASEGVVAVDNNDSANLNEAPVRTLNDCVAHCDGDLCSGRLVEMFKIRARSVYSNSTAIVGVEVHTSCRLCCPVSWLFAGAADLEIAKDFLMVGRIRTCACLP